MSALPVIVETSDACASEFFHGMLSALLNASNDEYEAKLADVLDYVSMLEGQRTITPIQASLRHVLAAKENERKAIRKAQAKLIRFDLEGGVMQTAEFGDWVSFYDMIQVVK
jgi:hypothetical protein